MTAQTTMRAAAIDRFGGVDEIKLEHVPIPQIDPDEVLIRVESAGVAVWDSYEREGGFAGMMSSKPKFPYVLGTDGAGTVAQVGEQVRNFKEGDHVYAASLASPKGGFYAEFAAVNSNAVSAIPGHLTVEQAGVLMSDGLTALRGLDEMIELKRGESILIFGASGGIGHLAVQLAKRMGAAVFAIASGSDGLEMVKRLGADAAVDGHKDGIAAAARQFAPDGLDTALMTAGGPAADEALSLVRAGGRAAHPNGVEPVPHAPPGIQISSYDVVPFSASLISKLNHLIEIDGARPFEVHLAKTFPLERAADAQRALDEHFLGKLALRP
jgi:NADPH:quinone reductase-like Zn-dependent oxidoreductase